MTNISRLLHGRHGVEQFLAKHAAGTLYIGVDREIAHAETGQILEEMGTLTGINTIVFQRYFHDKPRRADVRPLHGHT